MPVDSPAVIKLDPEHFLETLDSGFSWLVRDPAMWGAGKEGEGRVQGLIAARSAMFEDFGSDPLAIETWNQQGIDLSRPIHLALYPLPSQGVAFVDAIESELARRSKKSAEGSLADAMYDRPHEEVDRSGLYSQSEKLRRQSDALIGARLVLSIDDEALAMDSFDRVVSGDNYQRISRLETRDSSIARVYFSTHEEDLLTVVARTHREGSNNFLLIDLFTIPELAATTRDARQLEVMGHVNETLARTGKGRADAPAPSPLSVLSLGMNQRGVSSLLRYLSYRDAIELASTSATSQRDDDVYALLGQAVWQMNYWDTGARGIEGLSYELEPGGSFEGQERMFGFKMDIFGDPSLEPPVMGARAFDLGTTSSGASVSIDPALLFGAQWKTWLAPLNSRTRILDLLQQQYLSDESDEQGTIQSLFYLFASPRLLAQLVTTAEEETKQEVPIELMPVYAQRQAMTRIEAILPGLDVSNTFREPNVIFALSLSPELSALDRDAFTAALRDTLYYMSDYASSDDQAEEAAGARDGEEGFDRAEAMKPGQVLPFDVPSSSPLADMFYYYERDASSPFILIARGPDARQNLEALPKDKPSNAQRSQNTFRMKLDPGVLLQLSSNYDNRELSSLLNLSIMMQRIGPLLFTVKPERRDKEAVLEYRFDLLAPLQLDTLDAPTGADSPDTLDEDTL